ncbi:MAG: right-handed parallel beta-helix repeat-containing protein, partial [Candidatus Hodarchaeota archaeon]
SQYNQVKNCIFDGTNSSALGISIGHTGAASDYNLIEGCTFIPADTKLNNSKASIQFYGKNCTIRQNVFRDGSTQTPGNPLMARCIEANDADGSLIYNNTFYNNFHAAIIMLQSCVNIAVKNNIFYKNMHLTGYGGSDEDGYKRGAQILLQGWGIKGSLETSGNVFDYNFIQYQTAANYDPVVHVSSPLDYQYTLNEAQTNLENTFPGNNIEQTGGPKFTNESTRVLTLESDSPCIDAGIVVNDSTWGNLPYKGSAPDMGAFEYGSDSDAPARPTGVKIISQ